MSPSAQLPVAVAAIFIVWALLSPVQAGQLAQSAALERDLTHYAENALRDGEPAEVREISAGDEPAERAALVGPFLHGGGWIAAEYVYTGEVFTNMRGGINTSRATEYRGNLDLILTAELDDVGPFPGGTVVVYGQNGHGRGLTVDHVGDYQFLSNIDAFDFMQLSEYWWQRAVFDGRLGFKLGKQDCNADFAVVELGGDFIHSSFGFPPMIPMPTFPDPALGAVSFFQPLDWAQIQVGVYDGATFCRVRGRLEEGLFSIAEAKLNWTLGRAPCCRLPGDFHVGLWYHSGTFPDPTIGCPIHHSGDHGIYLGLDQWIWRQPGEDEAPERGLGAFAQYAWAPQAYNEPHQYVGSGLVYRGPSRARPEDVLGFGVAHLIFSDRLPDQTSETAVELFYKAPVAPWAVIQPDLQYVAQPGGNGRDAFVFGLRFELAL